MVENRIRIPLGVMTSDMPERQKHQFFSAFVTNPVNLSAVRAFTSFREPTPITAVTQRTAQLEAERFQGDFGVNQPTELEVETVARVLQTLGFATIGEDERTVQLSDQGRVYIERQLVLLEDL